ncbi:hypothetical protein A3H09_02195 [Candidatus Falkowbacteria bacterium RIFCSPLOWO2_12_FULL_45_13]|uniref:EfeO-type cupredoxin-like domain-containing protein n=2 Tax=Candidatus Falkowiibacteriota TaxID=1752728 RepID=A0A1F5SCR9_9BACT|nr:MAG: hypothetical protein A3H66_01620 [Candidatus Falkowbacteria bacterium RIFCSPLOWO2_02_FULL_45_21]OGF32139.1 MAG: hypothetical protein A3H09_02195 [Candidatus Falkowbacteria bacterium RIFCSPLOWO2_12_FULL_45_13]
MNKKIIIPVIIIGSLAIAAIIAFNKTNQTAKNGNTTNNAQNNNVAETAPVVTESKESAVKEFTMTSFYEIVDGQPRPQYSLEEIMVKKGDLVRIKITVTKGAHDFKIDEFGVYADTKELNKEYAVEFTADKTGEFIYYCTKPGHRQNGHWGTLKVLDN